MSASWRKRKLRRHWPSSLRRISPQASKPLILVNDPRAAFAKALSYFDWRRPPLPGIHPSAMISPSAAIHARAHIGAMAIIGDGVVIGEGSVVYPHAVIGNHVEIGKKSVIHPHVAIYARCKIGDRVTIHSGAVIGADGFGYNPGRTDGRRFRIWAR